MIEYQKEDIVLKNLLSLIILSAFGSALILDFESFSLNFSEITGILLFSGLLLHSAINRKQAIVLYNDSPSIFIYLYFLSNLFSSVFFSPNKIDSIKGCIVILLYVLIYISVRWAMKKIGDPGEKVEKLQKFNKWSAIFGIASMTLSFISHTENFGVSYGHLAQSGLGSFSSPLPSIRSFSLEPNLFAIITAAILCINLAIYLLYKRSRNQLIVIIILTVSIIFSYTRSVYISLFISLLALMILSRNVRLLLTLVNFGFIFIVTVAIIFYYLPDDSDIKSALMSRVTSLFEFQKGSGLGRIQGYIIGVEGFLKNPVFGNGTLSTDTKIYNIYTGEYQELMGSPGWLNGALIQALQDTGILGFIIVLGIFISVIVANYNIFIKLPQGDVEKSIILGFIGGNIILLITAQLSSSLWISFPYIYWGVNMSFIAWCKRQIEEKRAITNK